MGRKEERPIFPTGVAADIVGMNPKSLINYENLGLVTAQRSSKNRRLFSKKDLFTLMVVKYLLKEKKLTCSGVRYVLDLVDAASEDRIDLFLYVIPKDKREEFVKTVDV